MRHIAEGQNAARVVLFSSLICGPSVAETDAPGGASIAVARGFSPVPDHSFGAAARWSVTSSRTPVTVTLPNLFS